MRAKAPYTPHFWGRSHSIPQVVVLDVQPLVKSSFWDRKFPPMKFSILTPLPSHTWVPHFGGLGGLGGQYFVAFCGCCVWIWTWVLINIFHVYGPPNPWRVCQVQILGTPGQPLLWALASEDLAVFALDRLFSGT